MSHMRVTLALLSVCGCLCAVSGSTDTETLAAPDGSTFRKDYKFDNSSNGWLKLHLVPAPWQAARLACHLEGARLASPLTHGLYGAMRLLMNQGRRESLYTGVRTMYAEDDYYSVEGVHMTEMPLEWAEGEPDNRGNVERCLALRSPGLVADVNCNDVHAFACYREKVGFMAINECGTSDRGYVRKATGSCYKYHKTKTTWFRANSACTAEGGHLAIINSNEEAEILKTLTLEQNVNPIDVYVGFYNWHLDDSYDRSHWATLDGKSLEEAGFARWRQNEPNFHLGKEQCGSFSVINNEISLNDLSCDITMPFICEIEKPRIPLW